jgi:hypothetical protein
MLKGLFRLITLGLFFGGWALAGAALHVVRTQDKIAVIPKSRLGWTDTYVDLRQWTTADLPKHPDVVERLKDTGHDDLLKTVGDTKAADTTKPSTGDAKPTSDKPADSAGAIPHSIGLPHH